MNFQMKMHHIDGLDDVEAKLDEKIKRFERILPKTAYVEMEFKQLAKAQAGGDKEVEVLVDIPGQKAVIRFVAHGLTFLEAADQALDRLDSELSQTKERTQDHSLHHGRPIKEVIADFANQEEI